MKRLMDQDLSEKVRVVPVKGENTYFFGDNRDGRCGVNLDEHHIKKPQGLFNKYKKIFCGFSHNAAIDKNQVLYCWGKNRYG
mmetsp:Transcript_676/g.375  ORF Transcript_676/g.375 Transcript_676/m.375 type:complete len:82 (+) Transcript_676:318-563(+)